MARNSHYQHTLIISLIRRLSCIRWKMENRSCILTQLEIMEMDTYVLFSSNRSGSLKEVVDFSDFFGEYGGHKTGEVVSVNKEDSMKIRFYIMSFTTGPTQIDFDYVYTDGTLKPKSTIGTHHSMRMLVNGTNRRGMAAKTIPVYRSAGGSSKA